MADTSAVPAAITIGSIQRPPPQRPRSTTVNGAGQRAGPCDTGPAGVNPTGPIPAYGNAPPEAGSPGQAGLRAARDEPGPRPGKPAVPSARGSAFGGRCCVDELSALDTWYRVVRAEEYTGMDVHGDIEMPRPTDPEPAAPDWNRGARGPKIDDALVLAPAVLAEAANRLRAERLNEVEALNTVYRIARTRRLLRWGPTDPKAHARPTSTTTPPAPSTCPSTRTATCVWKKSPWRMHRSRLDRQRPRPPDGLSRAASRYAGGRRSHPWCRWGRAGGRAGRSRPPWWA
ncbi:DUF5954 family protein [Streptomyces sp. NPDC003863]